MGTQPPTIRVTSETREELRSMTKQTGKSQQELLEDAVKAYARQLRLERFTDEYARLQANPELWSKKQQEAANQQARLARAVPVDA